MIRPPSRLRSALGWLLTPLAAWAVAFLGAWLGARLFGGLLPLLAGGLLGGGVGAWGALLLAYHLAPRAPRPPEEE